MFHFTNLENLKSILEKGKFFPRYCLECSFGDDSNNNLWYIPMVSFCDIRLTQVKEHVEVYGKYALGLSKDWGISKKVNPVFYLTKECLPENIISDSLGLIIINTAIGGEGRATKEDIGKFQDILRYTKPYQGYWYKNANGKYERNEKQKIFYNEREWRYAPCNYREGRYHKNNQGFILHYDNISVVKSTFVKEFSNGERIFDWLMRNGYFEQDSGTTGYPKFITESLEEALKGQYHGESEKILEILQVKDKADKNLETLGIDFSPSDIKYIMVAEEREVKDIVEVISQVYLKEERNNLIRKIIVYNEIEADF